MRSSHQEHSRAGTCWPVEGKVSASRVRLSHIGEAASLAARLFLPCVTASLPAQPHHIAVHLTRMYTVTDMYTAHLVTKLSVHC